MSMLIMIADNQYIPVPKWRAGTPALFEDANTTYSSVCALSSTQAIVCYRDVGNSNKGTYCILDISGSTVTPGTPGLFEDASTFQISVCSLSSTQAIVCYSDAGNGSKGTYCILDISGSTVTPGTPGLFENAATYVISVCALSSTRALVCYQDYGNSSKGTYCILDISGSTVTPGTPALFENAATNYVSVYALSSTQALVCYSDAGNSNKGTYCILDISGSTVTPGTPGLFEDAATYYISVCALSSTQALVCYSDAGNSNKGTYCILDISGSTVTPGTPSLFENAATYQISVCSLSSTQALVCYQDNGNSNKGTYCILDISGSTVTPVTPALFENAATNYVSVYALSSTQAVVCYTDDGNSSKGTYCLFEYK